MPSSSTSFFWLVIVSTFTFSSLRLIATHIVHIKDLFCLLCGMLSLLRLLEEEWEAYEIEEYAKDNNHKITILPQKSIKNLDTTFWNFDLCLCSTDIIQSKIPTYIIDTVVPDTYENDFKELFKRDIKKIKFGELNITKPTFIKPIGNDKSFSGIVLESLEEFIENLPDKNTFVYQCEKVDILAEYRLFIGNDKIYGKTFMCGNNIIEYNSELDNACISACKGKFRCVDIGYSLRKNWFVVEINPPFSLDDYYLNLDTYMKYCIDAFQWIKKHMNTTH